MKVVSGREFARVLERHGWKLLCVKGSHHTSESKAASFAYQSRFTAAKR